jgi:hypothetical protein
MLVLFSYASLSYAMGRSHDNNFLNLLPYTALVLAALIPLDIGSWAKGAAAGMLASLVGLMVLFEWGAWSGVIKSHTLLQFKPRQFVASLSYTAPKTMDELAASGATSGINPVVVGHAIDQLHGMSKDPVLVINNWLLVQPREPVWSSMDNLANFIFMPSDYRARYIAHGAQRLHRSGWILVDKTMVHPWTDEFPAGYTLDTTIDMGPYQAMHYTPKP